MQDNGEIEFSQFVNAYKASIVVSGDTFGGKCTKISTSAAVLSSIFFILIFPFSLALIILSINEVVVVENGISLITNVFLSSCAILALTLTLPPLFPSL